MVENYNSSYRLVHNNLLWGNGYISRRLFGPHWLVQILDPKAQGKVKVKWVYMAPSRSGAVA